MVEQLQSFFSDLRKEERLSLWLFVFSSFAVVFTEVFAGESLLGIPNVLFHAFAWTMLHLARKELPARFWTALFVLFLGIFFQRALIATATPDPSDAVPLIGDALIASYAAIGLYSKPRKPWHPAMDQDPF